MVEMKLKAFAKINLGLDVLRRREDGYHEVRMIMQTIGLYDKIILKKIKNPEIQIKTNLFYVPENENNLAYQAAKLLMDEFHFDFGISIDLQKFIPVAAGMGGQFRRRRRVIWHEPDVAAQLIQTRVDGAGSEDRGGRALLHYERNSAGRGNRREINLIAAHAGVQGVGG